MARPRLTGPQPFSLGSDARRRLSEHGVPEGEAVWISSAILQLHELAEGVPLGEARSADGAMFVLDDLGSSWKRSSGDRDAAIAAILDRLAVNRVPFGGPEPTADQADWIERLRRFVVTCRDQRINFAGGLGKLLQLPNVSGPGAYWVVGRFWILGAVQARDVVSLKDLLLFGDKHDWWDCQRSYENHQQHRSNPASLLLWFDLQGPAAAQFLLEQLADLGLPEFLRLSRSLAYALGVWLKFGEPHHPESFSRGGPDFAAVCRRIFEEADRRAQIDTPAPDELRHVWLRFAWMAIEADESWPTPEVRARLMKAAADDVGRLRPLLRRASSDDEVRLKEREPHFRSCVALLFRLGSLWEATKPLLLAFRATGSRAVAFDLRYWPVGKDDDPPRPWEMVPRSLINLLHVYMGREQQGDPTLEVYRSEFAQFCLERLKSRTSPASGSAEEQGLVEPDPAWREGFIQAARCLSLNPKGKGHHILNWVRENDPDPEVREIASMAYTELRHQPSLPKGYSPRRAIFDALWWLRQAHLVSLNLGDRIDQPGASRTREEEARRTTEPTPG